MEHAVVAPIAGRVTELARPGRRSGRARPASSRRRGRTAARATLSHEDRWQGQEEGQRPPSGDQPTCRGRPQTAAPPGAVTPACPRRDPSDAHAARALPRHDSREPRAAFDEIARIEVQIAAIDRATDPPLG